MFNLHKSLQYTVQLLSTVKNISDKTGKPVTSSTIASATGISNLYLEQLGRKLRMAGVLTATRGPNGGYSLKMEPNKITLKYIIDNDIIRVNYNIKEDKPADRISKELYKLFEKSLKPFYSTSMVELKAFGKPSKRKIAKKEA